MTGGTDWHNPWALTGGTDWQHCWAALVGGTGGQHWWVGTGGWHCWTQVGGHRWVALLPHHVISCVRTQRITDQRKEPKMLARSCDQLCPITADHTAGDRSCHNMALWACARRNPGRTSYDAHSDR
ncbi:unnamed protein product [Staurois parvus]|uniref:Uncharacterized protein n=1 Tax=Staurois parvus TaxID=386267 RepID=A0ABN9FUM4_9NEOB|nr:unnamed protein product [Staurois parvus]